MRVIVIGGAGYIGSHVAQELLDRGHAVTVFDNLYSSARASVPPGARFVHGTILEPERLSDAIDGHDAIVHLAALKAAGDSMHAPDRYATANIGGTIHVLNAARRTNTDRLVFSSSAAVYGEPRYLPIDERHPTDPTNFYGYTKLQIEGLMEWYAKLGTLRYAALRYFNAAGYDPSGRVRGLEYQPANLLPVIMEVAIGAREELSIFGTDYDTPDGTGVRDYIHVSDLASAHALAIEYLERNERNLVVNLGSETGLSVRELLETARTITGRPIPTREVARRAGDPGTLVASSGLARRELSWEPRYSDPNTLVTTSWDAYRR